MVYVGYDRYFDFDDIFLAMECCRCFGIIQNSEKPALKREFREFVPCAFGKYKRPYFKEEDISRYLASRRPRHSDEILDTFHTFGICESIRRYTKVEELLKIISENNTKLGILYDRMSKGEDVGEEIAKSEEIVDGIKMILGRDLKVEKRRGANAHTDLYRDMLSKFESMARMEGKFDNETVDILKRA